MRKLFTILMTVLLSTNVWSQSPQKMSYQAVIRDASNNLVTNHAIGIRISILQGSVTGTEVYKEIYNPNPQTNSNGLVTFEIGGGIALTGTFTNIDWANGIYFIKTETDPTGGTNYTIAGTSQLLSVPYALYAKTAENGFSGAYSDLTGKPTLWDSTYASIKNKPTLFDGQYNSLTGKPNLSNVATSGSYNDLTNKPSLFTGIYSDLTGKPILWDSTWNSIKNKPTLFDGQYNSLTGKPTFSIVATSGSYNDLISKPTLFSGIYSDLTGKPSLWDSTWNSIKNKPILFDGQYNSLIGKPALSIVATSGSYNDLANRPTLFSGIYTDLTGKPALWDSTWNSIKNKPILFDGQYNSLTGKPTLSIVATSGSYNDLIGKPTIWDSTWTSIKNKPNFSTVATSGSYNDLINKPAGNVIGDMQYWNGTAWVMIPVGQPGQFLQLTSLNIPAWSGATYSSVTTTVPSSITSSTVTSGGNIINNGGGIITARGVCWSTTSNPTISNNKTSDTSSTGIFTSLISGLLENTTYYLRAYATNNAGTSYGNIVTFTTLTSPVIDVDSNIYQTVNIGTQIWMKENLKTTKFNNNTAIPLVTVNTLWQNLTTSGYCWYNNSAPTYKNTYGALYNWYTVNSNNLCPTGWHVPSYNEWTILINYLGGVSLAGDSLKSGNFTAKMGGARYYDGTFNQVGVAAGWWSATEYDTSNAWYWAIDNNQGSYVQKFDYLKVEGLSVRCIKN